MALGDCILLCVCLPCVPSTLDSCVEVLTSSVAASGDGSQEVGRREGRWSQGTGVLLRRETWGMWVRMWQEGSHLRAKEGGLRPTLDTLISDLQPPDL